MAVRVVNSCPIFRCACSPPPLLSPSRCVSFHFRPFKPHKNPSNLGSHSLRTRSQVFSFGAPSRFFTSLVESVIEELKAMSTRRRIRANRRSEVVFFCFLCFYLQSFDFYLLLWLFDWFSCLCRWIRWFLHSEKKELWLFSCLLPFHVISCFDDVLLGFVWLCGLCFWGK